MNNIPQTHPRLAGFLRAIAVAGTLALGLGRLHAGENFSSFLKGCDMSFTDENTDCATPFVYSPNANPFTTLAANGVTYVRLRVYVETSADSGVTTPPTWCNQAETLKMASEIEAAGLKLEIDFMYSDHMVGAGNGVQPVPAAWSGDSVATLESNVYNFTYGVLTALADQGTPADLVQIGNEINDGIIGASPGTKEYYTLLAEGCSATRAADSTIGIVLHYAGTSGAVTFFSDLINNTYATISFDAIGLSLYPQWFTLADMKSAFGPNQLGQFRKYLMVQETGFPWGTAAENGETPTITSSSDLTQTGYAISPAGQYGYLSAMLNDVNGVANQKFSGQCIGVFYWPADDVTGWDGRTGADFNCAMWDSVSEDLISDPTNGNRTSLSVFSSYPNN